MTTTTTITLKKNPLGGYSTVDGKFRVVNYMDIWTVCENISDSEDELTDFALLSDAREYIASKVA